MGTRIVRIPLAVVALSLLAGVGGVGLAAGPAQASTPPIVTVQDEGGHDGAAVDADGTQGDFKPATTGTVSGPIEVAVPQFTAG